MVKENRQVAKNYAQALYELGKNNIQTQEEILFSIASLNEALKKTEKATLIFNSPAITNNEKKELLNKLLKTSPKELVSFLFLLVDKKRFNILPEIENEFRELINNAKGIVNAEVFSANKLESNMLEKIKQTLERTLLKENEKIEIKNKINPKLIGGLKIKVRDLVYDGSVRSKLDGLVRELN